jgi:hypothetical protein
MEKAVVATICLAVGAGLGFTVGYYLAKSETNSTNDNEYVEPIQVDKSDISKPEKIQGEEIPVKPAKIANPNTTGTNYHKYVEQLKYKQESEHPTDEEPEDESDIPEGLTEEEDEEIREDCEETYEERIEREAQETVESMEEYKKEHEGKIELMHEDEWDTDFPETDYEHEDLYYFTESDILTDEDGKQVNENEYIGPKVRQVGWMRSPDDVIYVRNHPKETEYRIFKQHCTVEDWFA